MDPLSDVFALLKVRALVSARFEAGGKWAVRFPYQSYIKFGAAVRGGYWLTIQDEEPRRIEEGDTYILTNCPAYVIASDPAAGILDGAALYRDAGGQTVHLSGDDVVIVGGSFQLEENGSEILLDILPTLIVIPAFKPASVFLRDTLRTLDNELAEGSMGSSVVTSRLGEILLVQALRAYVESDVPTGWLGAIRHPKIGNALRLLHADVRKNWKVDELASGAGMSRSDFARKFKDIVGLPPLDYLIRWRMHLARRALRESDATVASIATSLGYSSESAFGNAFKRTFGRAPKRYWAQECTSSSAGSIR